MKIEYRLTVLIALSLALSTLIAVLVTARQSPEPLTGNWVVRTPSTNNDGTFRSTYLNLKQEGQKITGTIRTTQFYYHISESTGGPDGFTLTGSMMDGKNERKVQYEGKLVGDELHLHPAAAAGQSDADDCRARAGRRRRHPTASSPARFAPGC